MNTALENVVKLFVLDHVGTFKADDFVEKISEISSVLDLLPITSELEKTGLVVREVKALKSSSYVTWRVADADQNKAIALWELYLMAK